MQALGSIQAAAVYCITCRSSAMNSMCNFYYFYIFMQRAVSNWIEYFIKITYYSIDTK